MTKVRGGLVAGVLACAGLGLFAGGAFSGDQMPSPLGGSYATVGVAMRPAATQRPAPPAMAGIAGRSAAPRITQLISTQPIDVAADSEIVAIVRCSRKQGIPVTGGAIAPPAPAKVAIHVVSAFNPNGGNTPARAFYVGVRNLGPDEEQWLATLTCAKGIRRG